VDNERKRKEKSYCELEATTFATSSNGTRALRYILVGIKS
jgi:hypothetical protein